MDKYLFLINQAKKEKNIFINFKLFSTLLIIYMTCLPNLRAESIKDFQIEGISIGESALKYYTEDQIIKNSRDYYKDKLQLIYSKCDEPVILGCSVIKK